MDNDLLSCTLVIISKEVPIFTLKFEESCSFGAKGVPIGFIPILGG